MEFAQLNFFKKEKKIASKKRNSVRKNDSKKTLKKKYNQLYSMYRQLYEKLNIPLLEQKEFIIIGDLIAYPEYREAEINGTQMMSLDERIRIHNDYLEN